MRLRADRWGGSCCARLSRRAYLCVFFRVPRGISRDLGSALRTSTHRSVANYPPSEQPQPPSGNPRGGAPAPRVTSPPTRGAFSEAVDERLTDVRAFSPSLVRLSRHLLGGPVRGTARGGCVQEGERLAYRPATAVLISLLQRAQGRRLSRQAPSRHGQAAPICT
jgi:hypothetical protein